MSARILIVDDDRAFRLSTAALLRQDGYQVDDAENGQEAVEALKEGSYDLMLLDLRMPGVDGIRVVEVLRTWGEGIPILMISGFGTIDAAVEALHAGADDFLTKPVEPDVLSGRVRTLLERRPSTVGEPPLANEIIGMSGAMREVFHELDRVSPTETTVLITGETGTGKELIARAVHTRSPRADGPFVAVNCASLAEGLLESELFGHVKGAFTGAVRDKEGLFQAAHGGTIFLDEIGDVSPGLQHRLLRVLQERELTPVGAVRPIKTDARVVAATNRNLRQEVGAGRFREDLFYRLNVFRLDLPPLRERAQDIPHLTEYFVRTVWPLRAGALGRSETRDPRPLCSPLASRMLRAYEWPGNVRELFAAVESALIRAGGGQIEGQHLPPEVRESLGAGGAEGSRYRPDADPDTEAEEIRRALEAADGVRARAAEALGMGRTTLWRKMKQYGLVDEDGEA